MSRGARNSRFVSAGSTMPFQAHAQTGTVPRHLRKSVAAWRLRYAGTKSYDKYSKQVNPAQTSRAPIKRRRPAASLFGILRTNPPIPKFSRVARDARPAIWLAGMSANEECGCSRQLFELSNCAQERDWPRVASNAAKLEDQSPRVFPTRASPRMPGSTHQASRQPPCMATAAS
jgi:hypothetical protein